MKRNILLRTNFLVCFVIVPGFFFSALMGYRASQGVFRSYEDAYDLRVYLVSGGGPLALSTDRTGYEGTDFFQDRSYPELRSDILDTRERRSFWHGSDQGNCYLVTAFVPNLNWFLIVEKDTTAIEQELARQLLQEGAVV